MARTLYDFVLADAGAIHCLGAAMVGLDLVPHWDAFRTRIALSVLAALLVMSAVALVLHRRATTPAARAFALDFGRRTQGWWLILFLLTPAALAGGWVLLALLIAASVVAWREFAALQPDTAFRAADWVWVVPAVAVHFLSAVGRSPSTTLIVDGAIAALTFLATALARRTALASRAGWRVGGFVLAVVPLSAAAVVALRFGVGWLAFAIIVTQASDILQYVAGKNFGRHLLAPTISPHKTYEGLIGGLLGALVLGGLLGPLIDRPFLIGATWGLTLAVAGSAAGLVMSAAKRRQGAKDFGAWIPGQGGLLDRFDSLCGAAVVVLLCRTLG